VPGRHTSVTPSLRKPLALTPGDRLAIVAPASGFDRAALDKGLTELRRLGFEPVYEESLFARTGYVAGDTRLRAEALRRAWHDDSIAGIMAARGGYGSVHLLAHLDPSLRSKVFLGSSDLTTLQVWLVQRAQMVTFHAPMIAGALSRGVEGYDRDVFMRSITRPEPLGELPARSLEVFVPGEAVGPLLGGTLTQLAASLGTPYAFDPPTGSVLFLEDVNERPYRLDRLVTQLMHSGVLARVAAVILGTFPGCDEPGGQATARSTLAALFAGFDGPVVFGLPAGHVDGPALTLPLGVRTRVVAEGVPRVIVEEAAVSSST
jgi:muramoyltetrapeptide carboxypeptidase